MLAAVLACCAPAVSAWSTIRPGISAAPRGGCRAVLGMSADVAAAASAVTDVRSAEALRRRLTVSISEEERAAGVLLPETLRVAADVVTQHGVVLLEGGLDSARCDDCRASAMRALDECVARLKARGVDYRTSFAYREVVHRAPLRYDVSLQPGTGLLPLPAQTGRALAEGLWQPLIRRLLGRDARHNFDGAFIALPGAGAQRPHMDGGHLFHSTHGFSLDVPVHIVNVFVPLGIDPHSNKSALSSG
jgi:membrane protein implicated in regulation of membrane protease activity